MSPGAVYSSEDTRLGDVPSLEDLEKIERYAGGEESESLYNELVSETVKRLAARDERLEDVSRTIFGNSFTLEGLEGRIDGHFGDIVATGFRDDRLRLKDALLVEGAARNPSYSEHERDEYVSALERAGRKLEDASDTEIRAEAGKLLEEIEYDSFTVEVEGSIRETYNDVIERLDDPE